MLPISCRGLMKRWGETVGIADLDLDIEAGSVTGFVGPNGAGKHALVRRGLA